MFWSSKLYLIWNPFSNLKSLHKQYTLILKVHIIKTLIFHYSNNSSQQVDFHQKSKKSNIPAKTSHNTTASWRYMIQDKVTVWWSSLEISAKMDVNKILVLSNTNILRTYFVHWSVCLFTWTAPTNNSILSSSQNCQSQRVQDECGILRHLK